MPLTDGGIGQTEGYQPEQFLPPEDYKCKEQYQDDNGDIAINDGVDHIHGEHFHKREVGCGRCGQFSHIVLTEKPSDTRFKMSPSRILSSAVAS